MNILIIDDNAMDRKHVQVTLEAEGYRTIEAADGIEALQVLEQEVVDIIFTDILMPNMDGYRFCYEARKRERLKSIPIIICTSTYDSAKDEKLALDFGASRFIRKPIPAAAILNAIREVTGDTFSPAAPPFEPPDEATIMTAYSEQLVRKLEDNYIEIQQEYTKCLAVNRTLQRRINQLEVSEEKFRGIFENILDVCYRTDIQGTIQLISPSIERYGYLPDELIGKNIRDLYADPATHEKIFKALVEKKSIEDREITLKRKDGETFVASLSARRLTDHHGRIIGREGTFRDISERKHLEAQLIEAQKMEGIGRLAGGVAHDFNNLLTVIMGCTELACDQLPEDHSSQNLLQNVLQASERAANLTRQLLAFARRQVIEPKVIDPNELIKQTSSMLRRLIGEDIELVTLPRSDVGRVKVDVGQMEQVLVNLAINARDAMPDGGKLTIETVDIRLDEEYAAQHVEVDPGEYVMLAVSDTGIGMDETTKAHLFEPFFTTKEQGKGTGLGLATCHGIVKQNGGHIWLNSEPGKGATFKVYLPRVEETAEVLPLRGSSGDLPRGEETILLVEDDSLVRAVAVQVLNAQGYTVLEAANGVEALFIAADYAGHIQLLVTDVVMPQMGGRVLAERLQTAHQVLKVLYMSGYTDNAIVHRGVLAPGVAFLQKPFTPSSLARKVREVLDA